MFNLTDELSYLEAGLVKLQEERNRIGNTDKPRMAAVYKASQIVNPNLSVQISHQIAKKSSDFYQISIESVIQSPDEFEWVRLRYRPVNQHLDY